MRKLYIRGRANVLKRVLVQAAAFNIGLLLRKVGRWGKPRTAPAGLRGNSAAASACSVVRNFVHALLGSVFPFALPRTRCRLSSAIFSFAVSESDSATACSGSTPLRK